MALEPGEEFDCPACGDTHRVERGKGLEVPGSTAGLEPGIYVRCPAVGVFDPEEGPAAGGDSAAEGRGATEDEDWP